MPFWSEWLHRNVPPKVCRYNNFLFSIATIIMAPIIIRLFAFVSDSLFKSGNHGKFGMPSDHSQHIFFIATFFILLVVNRLYYKTNNKSYQYVVKGVLVLAAEVTALLVSYSRVYLEYHTVEQVVVGGVIGTISGAIWFFLVHYVFSPYFHMITNWKVSEYLMIRDYTHIPNVLLFQYKVERNEAGYKLC